jgi:lysozyme
MKNLSVKLNKIPGVKIALWALAICAAGVGLPAGINYYKASNSANIKGLAADIYQGNTNLETAKREAVPFIARHEGYRFMSYRCAAGVWTVGYGHTKDVGILNFMSFDNAIKNLAADIDLTAQQLRELIKPEVFEKLSTGQKAALISLGFNVGIDKLKGTKLIQYINLEDFVNAQPQMDFVYITKGRKKVISPGLFNRRIEEMLMFGDNMLTPQAYKRIKELALMLKIPNVDDKILSLAKRVRK